MTLRPRILIVGGAGAFGRRAGERLAREGDLDIVLAGRSLDRARGVADELAGRAMATLSAAVIDATRPDRAVLAGLAPYVIVNASGPFQAQDNALAQAAVAIGAHYIDLADATGYVAGFTNDTALDTAARARGVLAVTGASTVPALSAAVVDHLAPGFARITTLRYGVSPGNSFDPGPATTASILSGLGRPFRMKHNGDWSRVHGWQGFSSHRFPAFGTRRLGYCDIPDLELFAARYPTLETTDFRAGVEVAAFHLGLWGLSWLVRGGMLRRPERLTPVLLAAKRRLGFLGSDAGGMFLTLGGIDRSGLPKVRHWHMEAFQGHGPNIPTTPAVILARRLARGEAVAPGARACLDLVSLSEIERELADLDIRFTTT